MSPLLVPVFAQLVTLQLSDRTEARYVKADIEQFEGSTYPRADLSLTSGRTFFNLGYGPSLTLQPLEEKPRELSVLHDAGASIGYRWATTGLTLSSNVGYGEINFRTAALQGSGLEPEQLEEPTMGAAEPEPGQAPQPAQPDPGQELPDPSQTATGQLRVVDRLVRYYSNTTTLTLDHRPRRDVDLSAHAGHTRGGGLGDSRREYPLLSAWFVGGSAAHVFRLSSRDTFTSSLGIEKTWSSNGNEVATLTAQEAWQHAFSRNTYAGLGGGLGITRFSQTDGLRGFSVFPTFQAFLSHSLLLWRGTLAMSVFGYSAPALDPLRALVDPRVGVGGNVNYSRKKFSISITGTTALSLAHEDNDAGAIDSAQADGRVGYQIGEYVGIDAGARYARQVVQDVTVLPSSYSAFVGLNLGYAFRLGKH